MLLVIGGDGLSPGNASPTSGELFNMTDCTYASVTCNPSRSDSDGEGSKLQSTPELSKSKCAGQIRADGFQERVRQGFWGASVTNWGGGGGEGNIIHIRQLPRWGNSRGFHRGVRGGFRGVSGANRGFHCKSDSQASQNTGVSIARTALIIILLRESQPGAAISCHARPSCCRF